VRYEGTNNTTLTVHTNVVTLNGTIILQILKSLCKTLNSKDPGLEAYVIGNMARPLLSYGPKNSRSMRRTFLYIEAIQKFEQEMREVDLSEAYKKARPAFNGRLERNFVVLKDQQGEDAREVEQVATGANLEPIKK
jgi:hypothetical protein